MSRRREESPRAEPQPIRPPRALPVLYLVSSHLFLGTALATVALAPASVAGFWYHPRMVAAVHLVTLGWITASILGALYMVSPLAMRVALPARRGDYVAFAAFSIGVAGMAAHFWIAEPSGMAWAAAVVYLALVWVGARALAAFRGAPIQGGVKLHVALAFVNLWSAGAFGLLLAVNKLRPVLPGYVLANVAAHAHLAAFGWATMMVMGFGYRLLPMLLPAAMPAGRSLAATAIMGEAGLALLVLGLVRRDGWAAAGALLVVAALALFLRRVAWMARNRRPAPKELLRPDYGVLHVAQALVWLAVAAALGLAIALTPPGEWKLGAAMAYGVLALLGFLAQMIVGVNARLLPIFAWLASYGRRLLDERPPSPHDLPYRPLQAGACALWAAGIPLLAWGLAADRLALVSAGGWALLAGLAMNAATSLWTLRVLLAPKSRPATGSPGPPSSPPDARR